jgi:Outer membrane protein beta-barrel domain
VKAQLYVVTTLAALLCAPWPAAAQRRMPHTGANGAGAEVGVFAPQQDGMSTGPEIAGFFEHYLTARDSVRLVGGWANPKVSNTEDRSTREVRLGGELVHNWEGGAIHPFVGAGLGAYFLQARVNDVNVGESATKLGGTVLGGAEFFASKTFSVKGEIRYNAVAKWNTYDPSGLALTIGVKSYF